MKLLAILFAAVALLAGCAGTGPFDQTSGASGFDDPERSVRALNPLNDPTNPYPYYGA